MENEIIKDDKVAEVKEETLTKENKEKAITEEKVEKKEKLTRAQKKERRIKKRYFFEEDIKYRGPLNYRSLRVCAWIAIALAQMAVINNVSQKLIPPDGLLNPTFAFIIDYASILSVPLFTLAAFATILNKKRSYKTVISFYAVAYLAIGFGIMFIYNHYITNLANAYNLTESKKAIDSYFSGKLRVNVFADLLALTLFDFFLQYKPKKHFQGKNRILFRLCAFIPVLIALTVYAYKTFAEIGIASPIPFSINMFLPTKPPAIYFLFICISFWVKIREKKYYKYGGTKEGYRKFVNSNKNSLAFSLATSAFCAIISVVEFITLMIVLSTSSIELLLVALSLDVGAGVGLILVVPILLLFSYSKRPKSPNGDIYVALFGVGINVLVYIEMIYRILVKVAANLK